MSKRVRYAIVGQGYITQVAVLPAFANARRNSEICALFSDDPTKLRKLGRKYGVEHLYGYEDYERALVESAADAVYIALPNDLHREYTECAAAMGVHVLFTISFGASDVAAYEVVGTRGTLRLDSAYEYAENMTMTVKVGDRKKEKTFPQTDQFAPELLHFSDCVLSGREPRPSGQEGRADVQVIEALYRSAEKGVPVRLADLGPGSPPRPRQLIERPAVEEPELVKATPPSGKS